MIRLPDWFSIALLALAAMAAADVGMRTYDHFPAAEVARKYGFDPTPAWLDHLRLASVRIAGGCSASVVPAGGRVMTNHHGVSRCIENLAGLAHQDCSRAGFLAPTLAAEAHCPCMELNQLVEIVDVTERVQQATRATAPDRFAGVQKAALADLEKQCATADEFRGEVVALFRGGRYDLYRYRRFQDIRSVFAPEAAIAFFGGDPDNLVFPRHDLDVAFVRIYGSDGQPRPMVVHLAWSTASPREGELTFVSGNPGSTSRSKTMAQIDDDRDWRLPRQMNFASELRGFLTDYPHRGAEQRGHSQPLLFGVENRLKRLKGQHAALADKTFYARLAAAERALRDGVAARPGRARPTRRSRAGRNRRCSRSPAACCATETRSASRTASG